MQFFDPLILQYNNSTTHTAQNTQRMGILLGLLITWKGKRWNMLSGKALLKPDMTGAAV